MKSIETRSKRIIVAKVEPDEDLINSVIKLVKKYDIKSGFIKCIGALKKFTIGFYDISSKNYKMKTFDEYVELISCIGNISYKNKEPIVHLHVTLGRNDYSVIGGHLSIPSIISITGEVQIVEIDQKLSRADDPRFDLSLLNI
ncbi:MAG: DNA-binding protein [Promethearchaeota archaeon]|nr:MAG: DNA-binding protein [Candidatus Lokiarchaeota archaeon]